jgi:hypothetical protein
VELRGFCKSANFVVLRGTSWNFVPRSDENPCPISPNISGLAAGQGTNYVGST